MLLIVNFLVFQMAWLLSVIGGATAMPWLGPVAVVAAIALHLRAARNPLEEVVLIGSCALIGALFDSLLVAAGWVSYRAGQFHEYLAPYWIITMWMLFGTTLNVSLRWLRGRMRLASLFGLVGGPAAYLAGQQLGGIVLTDQLAALTALAVGWAALMPALLSLAGMFDGMPGKRRAWIAEPSA